MSQEFHVYILMNGEVIWSILCVVFILLVYLFHVHSFYLFIYQTKTNIG